MRRRQLPPRPARVPIGMALISPNFTLDATITATVEDRDFNFITEWKTSTSFGVEPRYGREHLHEYQDSDKCRTYRLPHSFTPKIP